MYRRTFLQGLSGTAALPWVAGLAKPATAQGGPTIVPIFSSPFGAGTYEGNAIFGNILARNGEDLIVQSQETPGYMYNVREMANAEGRWATHVFGCDASIIQLGALGGTPDLKEFLPEKLDVRFQFLHGEGMWAPGKFFVTIDPNIKTPHDMKGKRISLGNRTQSSWGVFARLLLKAGYGITAENSDIRHMPPSNIHQQLIDGTTDVGLTSIGTDPAQESHLVTPLINQVDVSGRDVFYISIDEEALERTNKEYGTSLVMMTFAPGVLPQQDEPLHAGMDLSYKAVHPQFEEETAYQFVKLAHKYQEQMAQAHNLWSIMTHRMMVTGLTEENTHPGAIRAFKELGLWDSEWRTESSPITYPDSLNR